MMDGLRGTASTLAGENLIKDVRVFRRNDQSPQHHSHHVMQALAHAGLLHIPKPKLVFGTEKLKGDLSAYRTSCDQEAAEEDAKFESHCRELRGVESKRLQLRSEHEEVRGEKQRLEQKEAHDIVTLRSERKKCRAIIVQQRGLRDMHFAQLNLHRKVYEAVKGSDDPTWIEVSEM